MQNKHENKAQLNKSKMLDVFKAFIEICNKHDLQYFCHGGTAIGVIRHQGFIPWDDDIDVLMPRPDYERFIDLFPQIQQNEYELHVPGKNKFYYLPFTKLCDKNTTLLEFSHIPYVIGAFIDIFPLDSASPSPEVRAKDWLNFRQTANKLMILPKSAGANFKWFFKRLSKLHLRTALYELECAFGKTKKEKEIHQKLRKISTHIPYDQAEYVGSYGSQFGTKAFWPKAWFDGYVTKEFEGVSTRVPKGYDQLLTQVYGDYMQLPPKEKRISHHHVAYMNLSKQLTIEEILAQI